MITYCYKYKDTPEDNPEYCELVQSIKDEPYTVHPENNRPIERTIVGCNPAIIIEPGNFKTLGNIASKNTEEMEKRGDPRVKKKEKAIPWWRKDKKKPKDFSGYTQKQIERYIWEGK